MKRTGFYTSLTKTLAGGLVGGFALSLVVSSPASAATSSQSDSLDALLLGKSAVATGAIIQDRDDDREERRRRAEERREREDDRRERARDRRDDQIERERDRQDAQRERQRDRRDAERERRERQVDRARDRRDRVEGRPGPSDRSEAARRALAAERRREEVRREVEGRRFDDRRDYDDRRRDDIRREVVRRRVIDDRRDYRRDDFRCRSVNGRRVSCAIDGSFDSVRFVRGIDGRRCRQGVDFGITSRGVWVTNGCAAQFEVLRAIAKSERYGRGYGYSDRYYDGYGRFDDRYGRYDDRFTVACSSKNRRKRVCGIDGRFSDVRLIKVRSDAPCRRGRDWGVSSRGVWVDNGCRATFAFDRRGRGYARRY